MVFHTNDWSNESRFLLPVMDGRVSVWRHRNTVYTHIKIMLTVPYEGDSVMMWICLSHDFKLDLITIEGNLTGSQYIDNCPTTSCYPLF